jgi:hypothetical protein
VSGGVRTEVGDVSDTELILDPGERARQRWLAKAALTLTHVDPIASRRRVVRVYDRAARIYDV